MVVAVMMPAVLSIAYVSAAKITEGELVCSCVETAIAIDGILRAGNDISAVTNL